MVRRTQPDAQDGSGHGGTVQNVLHSHIGNAGPLGGGYVLEGVLEFLEKFPASPGVDHLLVLAQAGRGQLAAARFRLAQIFGRQQSSADRAVGQQLNVVLPAELDHPYFGTPVDQRKFHLVGN